MVTMAMMEGLTRPSMRQDDRHCVSPHREHGDKVYLVLMTDMFDLSDVVSERIDFVLDLSPANALVHGYEHSPSAKDTLTIRTLSTSNL